jgi:hypothetical protein
MERCHFSNFESQNPKDVKIYEYAVFICLTIGISGIKAVGQSSCKCYYTISKNFRSPDEEAERMSWGTVRLRRKMPGFRINSSLWLRRRRVSLLSEPVSTLSLFSILASTPVLLNGVEFPVGVVGTGAYLPYYPYDILGQSSTAEWVTVTSHNSQ